MADTPEVPPGTPGGSSGGSRRDIRNAGGPDELTRSEMRFMERAIRKSPRFVLDDELARVKLPEEMTNIALHSAEERNQIAAARVIVAMDQANMEQEKRDAGLPDQTVNHTGEVKLTVSAVAAQAAERLDAYRRNRLGHSTNGTLPANGAAH
jgi:hypothetical protein